MASDANPNDLTLLPSVTFQLLSYSIISHMISVVDCTQLLHSELQD